MWLMWAGICWEPFMGRNRARVTGARISLHCRYCYLYVYMQTLKCIRQETDMKQMVWLEFTASQDGLYVLQCADFNEIWHEDRKKTQDTCSMQWCRHTTHTGPVVYTTILSDIQCSSALLYMVWLYVLTTALYASCALLLTSEHSSSANWIRFLLPSASPSSSLSSSSSLKVGQLAAQNHKHERKVINTKYYQVLKRWWWIAQIYNDMCTIYA